MCVISISIGFLISQSKNRRAPRLSCYKSLKNKLLGCLIESPWKMKVTFKAEALYNY